MLEVIGFFIGVHLTMTLFAACYRLIDLGYCLSEFWLEIVARISLNAAVIFLIYFLTTGNFREGFLIGQLFFTLFHIGIFWIARLLTSVSRRFRDH